MTLLKWLGYAVVISFFLYFLRETVRIFSSEDAWFIHYFW